MPAQIQFFGNNESIAATGSPDLIEHTASSGIGFFGNGFGISVPVGQYQDATYVTNGNGTESGVKLSNTKRMSESTVSHNGGGPIGLNQMPNYYAPLNIAFIHDEPVRVQNAKLRVFDRNDIARHASGVSTSVYEVRHPHGVEGAGFALANRGETVQEWQEFDPEDAMFDMTLTSSPGVSGTNSTVADGGKDGVISTDGAAHQAARHDWYVALSASPDSIGTKTDFGLYFVCEYL